MSWNVFSYWDSLRDRERERERYATGSRAMTVEQNECHGGAVENPIVSPDSIFYTIASYLKPISNACTDGENPVVFHYPPHGEPADAELESGDKGLRLSPSSPSGSPW